MTVETILPRAQRGPGICHTPALAIQAGATRVRVESDLAPDDLADPSVVVLGALFASTDGGRSWQFVGSLTFVGSAARPDQFWAEATMPPAAPGTLVRASAALLRESGCRFGMKVSAG